MLIMFVHIASPGVPDYLDDSLTAPDMHLAAGFSRAADSKILLFAFYNSTQKCHQNLIKYLYFII